MAGSSETSPDKLLCRFYAMSQCRDGDKCLFSHDRNRTTTWDNVCRFHLQGRCHYGSRCRFDHTKIRSSQNKPENKRNEPFKCPGPSQVFLGLPSSTAANGTGFKRYDEDNISGRNFSNHSENETTTTKPGLRDWVNAPEFIPKCKPISYAETVMIGQEHLKKRRSNVKICPYYEIGECPFGDTCDFVHGEVCEICGNACLLPFDNEQQQKHKDKCEKALVEDMELSFAIQRSKGKTCGICFDVIMEKQPLQERRFGIMEKCNHVFCLSCIRKWRQVKPDIQYLDNVLDTSVTRACPECRLPSDFVTPSSYYVDNEEEKKKLIEAYKTNLSKKPCKYFRKGEGNCPFAGACFYLHEYPDGTKATLPPPTRRRRQNHNGDLDFVERIFLSDFFDTHDDQFLMQMDFRDLMYVLSDSDDDDSEENCTFVFDESL